MDKIAPVIAWIRKNAFWLGCGLIALVMIGTYFLARNSVEQARLDNEKKIKGFFSTVTTIKGSTAAETPVDGESAHPNNSTTLAMTDLIQAGENSALKAWEIRYNDQKKLFKWPEEEINNKDFIEKFSQFKTAEVVKEATANENSNLAGYRAIYKSILNKRMENLSKIVKTTWAHKSESDSDADTEKTDGDADLATPEGGGGTASADEDMISTPSVNFSDDLVVWNQKNQDLWLQKITQFRGVGGGDTDPTLYEVMLIQEDLWVFESILNIVASVNEGSDANDLADVKQIDHILLGREAWLPDSETNISTPNIVADKEEVEEKESAVSDTSEMGELGGRSENDPANSEVDGGESGQKAPAFNFNESNDPSHGRYAGLKFEPISADDVSKAVNATELTDLVHFSVAKRIPVRVGLVMNEKSIGEFLAACANANLIFEVRQVRINRHTPGDGSFSMGGGAGGAAGGSAMDRPEDGSGGMAAPSAGGGGAGASVGGDYESAGGGGGGAAGGGGRDSIGESASTVDARTNYDVSVEFYGIIKIYNPVKYGMLNQTKSTEAPDDDSDKSNAKDEKAADDKSKAKP